MRIVAGEFRGRQLKSPTWEGLRPTSDTAAGDALFNILGPSIRGGRFSTATPDRGDRDRTISRGAADR